MITVKSFTIINLIISLLISVFMMHPWMRLPDIANMLGLTLASLALFITGFQINDYYVKILGILSTSIFFIYFIVLLVISIFDYVELYPSLTRGFWIFKY